MNKDTNYNATIDIKPDIIIRYSGFNSTNLPTCVIYVRPQTNIVSYEKAILKGTQKYANVSYMANLNGMLFLKDALILDHYACEYRFAIYAGQEIEKYPEMIDKFENFFNIKFKNAKIIGSFDAILLLGKSPKELYDCFVEEKEFLKLYGQTIKKIKDFYIVNYDIPQIINEYNTHTNIFIVSICFKKEEYSFEEVNQSIINEILNDDKAAIIDEDKLNSLSMYDKIKRTYHLSSNHIKAMFDMTDFIFKNDCTRINFIETPLGKNLIDSGFTEDHLKSIKEYPILYVNKNNNKTLINIIEEANGRSFSETLDIFKTVLN